MDLDRRSRFTWETLETCFIAMHNKMMAFLAPQFIVRGWLTAYARGTSQDRDRLQTVLGMQSRLRCGFANSGAQCNEMK